MKYFIKYYLLKYPLKGLDLANVYKDPMHNKYFFLFVVVTSQLPSPCFILWSFKYF